MTEAFPWAQAAWCQAIGITRGYPSLGGLHQYVRMARMAGTGIDARLAKRQFEFLFEKPDLRARAPGAKDLARRQGRRSGAGTVPD
jgi:hypothetical protein